MDGMQDVNEGSPLQYRQVDLVLTIVKTARAARFIRSSTAVKISSKINWYNLVNPFWWCSCFFRRRRNDDESNAER